MAVAATSDRSGMETIASSQAIGTTIFSGVVPLANCLFISCNKSIIIKAEKQPTSALYALQFNPAASRRFDEQVEHTVH